MHLLDKQGPTAVECGVRSRAVVAHVVADAMAKAQAQAAEEQAARDAAKAEYEAELARVSACILDGWNLVLPTDPELISGQNSHL